MHKRSYHNLLLTILCGLLVDSFSDASNKIEAHLLPREQTSETKVFFHQENDWSPTYTDAKILEIEGGIENQNVSFLLLSVNDTQYPLLTTDGSFRKPIHLEPGKNTLLVSTNLMEVPPVKLIVFKVEPAKLLKVENRFEGGVDQVIKLPELPPGGTTTVELQSPVVRIVGKNDTQDIVNLKVRDSYNNTLPVESLPNGIFAVNYTLREHSSYLTFLSSLHNRTLDTIRLNLELEDIIQLNFQSDQVPHGWIVNGPEQNHPISQLDTVVLQGRLRAVENGDVELITGGVSKIIPVENHLFTTEIPLQLNSLNRGRVRVNLNNQSFFESFQIEQKEPTIKVISLHQMVLDGSLFQPKIELHPKLGVPLELRECVIRLRGTAQFLGELNLVLERIPDGKRLPIEVNFRKFDSSIPLEIGSFSYNLLLEGDGFSRPYYSFEVNVQPGIKVEAVNFIPYRKGKMKLMRNEITLRGVVFGIKRGLMQLNMSGESYPIPVLDGQFEMDNAIEIPSGSNSFELTLREGNSIVRREYEFEISEFVIPDVIQSGASTTEEEEEEGSDSVDQESKVGL